MKSRLESIIGRKINNYQLFETAFTHSSYANENNCESNERLEFLGDAVLELCVSTYLFNKDNLSEGLMTEIRKQKIRSEALVIYFKILDLKDFLKVGKGELDAYNFSKPNIIADCFEALLGAIYLEFGFDGVYDFFTRKIVPLLQEALTSDYKSMFQEEIFSKRKTIRYNTKSVNGSRNLFFSEVFVDNILFGNGYGKNKKDAEQEAAKSALEKKV